MLRRVILAVAMLLATSASALADGVPAGWQRDDYIAYLVLADLLDGMTRDGDDLPVVCIANDIGNAPTHHIDASAKVIEGLRAKFASGDSHMRLRLASECREVPGRVEEQATGEAAMYVYATSNTRQVDRCGAYEAHWHRTGRWGGGTFYVVNAKTVPLSVMPTGCMSAE